MVHGKRCEKKNNAQVNQDKGRERETFVFLSHPPDGCGHGETETGTTLGCKETVKPRSVTYQGLQ